MIGATLEAAYAARESVARRLAHVPQVRSIGVAVLDDGFGIKVNLSDPIAPGIVPDDVDGVPVVVSVVGTIRAS